MKSEVVLLGGGGREHALGLKLSESPYIEGIYSFPGNAGTQADWANLSLEGELDMDTLPAIADFAIRQDAFVVVSTDKMLGAGAVDYLTDRRVPAFGPTKDAARLESDKAWAADFKTRHGIPSPDEKVFDTFTPARNYVRSVGFGNTVIKASGLADGKGVVVPNKAYEAEAALRSNLIDRQFGEASDQAVIQERLYGAELSVFTLTDGERIVMLPTMRDYKRLRNGNKGPNTGGMGAYGPVEIIPELAETIEHDIVRPTIEGMAKEGYPFKGILYTGLMLTNTGPKVIEYNARFGDPECQAQMLLIDEDIYPRLWQAARGTLTEEPIRLRPGYAVTVALATPGYPEKPILGSVIYGLEKVNDAEVFHAGTARENGFVKTAGGRVLHIASYGETLQQARFNVLKNIGKSAVHFSNPQYRTDIADVI